MKILIVSWYFPPCNTMGALRIGKFAKYLVGRGHDVRIVCAKDQPHAMTLPVEVPAEIVHYTRWGDVNVVPAKVQALRVWLKRLLGRGGGAPEGEAAAPAPADAGGAGAGGGPGLLRRILTFYQHATNVPDGMIGWLPHALRAGRAATRGWSPDVVFASAPPFTTLLAGRSIAKRTGAPLVIEYRDRWVEDPYGYTPPLRRKIDERLENWCARPARAVVTVSAPWEEDYRARWGKPVVVAYNGFDPDDVRGFEDVAPDRGATLNILYTGILYPERRDPTPLFQALARMPEAKERIRVNFYGSNVASLEADVARHGLQGIVAVHPGVPFRESLRLQRAADVLLLLQWNNVLERGNVPGKVFEYFAARRPILGIGYEDGVPARLMRERGAGRVLNDPDAIAAYLRELLAQKAENGEIALLPESVPAGLSRPEQYAGVEALFATVIAERAGR
jgi:hypothetical protein